MRPIPSNMLSKIKSAQQTLYGNADPRVEIVIQRNNRYIEEGTELQPTTIRSGSDLGSLDLAMRREDPKKAPDLMYMIYIEDGIAKVATQTYVNTVGERGNWIHQYDIGPAVDVAIEFDGYWVRTSKDAEVCFDDPALWTHVTEGEPWLFRVTESGQLVAQHGQGGSPITLAQGGVESVTAVRTWKSFVFPDDDNGLIVAYTINNTPHYRALCEQSDGAKVWENQRDIPTAPSTAQSIGVFRTNDYRTGFAVESNGELHSVISGRNWAGMAVPPEAIDVAPVSVEAELIPIIYPEAFHRESVTAAIAEPEFYLGYAMTDNYFLEIYNEPVTLIDEETEEEYEDWGKVLIARTKHRLYNLSAGDFQIIDTLNRTYTGQSVEEVGERTYKVTFVDFNDVDQEGILYFLGQNTTNFINQVYDPFNKEFYPVNLNPTAMPRPEVEVIYNV